MINEIISHLVPIQSRNEDLLSKVNEVKGLRGGDPWYAAQAIPPIDAEIGQKDHFMDGNY